MELSELLDAIEVREKHYAEGQRRQWRQIRWQTAVLLNIHTKKAIQPTDLFKLDDDDDTKEVKELEVTKELQMKWDKWDLEEKEKFEKMKAAIDSRNS